MCFHLQRAGLDGTFGPVRSCDKCVKAQRTVAVEVVLLRGATESRRHF